MIFIANVIAIVVAVVVVAVQTYIVTIALQGRLCEFCWSAEGLLNRMLYFVRFRSLLLGVSDDTNNHSFLLLFPLLLLLIVMANVDRALRRLTSDAFDEAQAFTVAVVSIVFFLTWFASSRLRHSQ